MFHKRSWLIPLVLAILTACSQAPVEKPENATELTPTALGSYGNIQRLGVLPGHTRSSANAVSADGRVVVGYSNSNAFRWTAEEGMQDLGRLPGDTYSSATAISADGSVVFGSGSSGAFRWTKAGGMQALNLSDVKAASADGNKVLGVTKEYADVIYDVRNGSIQRLAETSVPECDDGSTLRFYSLHAQDMDDSGTIVSGYGTGSCYISPYYTDTYAFYKWTNSGAVQEVVNSSRGAHATHGGGRKKAILNADGNIFVAQKPFIVNSYYYLRATRNGQEIGIVPGYEYTHQIPDSVSADGNVITGVFEYSTKDYDTVYDSFLWTAEGGTINFDGSSIVVSADGSVLVGQSYFQSVSQATVWRKGSAKNPQTITFTSTRPTDARVGGSHTVSATASSGLPVSFSSSTPAVCTVSGNIISFVGAGGCTVTASQAGDATYEPTSAGYAFYVAANSKQNQTITFTSTVPTNATVAGTYAVSATASSGLAVSFASTTSGVCTVSGSTVRFVSVGTCTINANQAGNTSYNPAPTVSQSFSVSGPATYTANFTSAPVGRVISSVKLGQGISSSTGNATGTVSLYARRKDKSGNMAMVASSARHFIISKDGVVQTSYTLGGTMDFEFGSFGTGTVTARSIKVKSTTTTGGSVKVYRGSTLVKTVSVPKTGVGVIKTLTLDVSNASLIKVTFTGSGAVDDLLFTQ